MTAGQYIAAVLASPYVPIVLIAGIAFYLLKCYSIKNKKKRGVTMKENAAFASEVSMNIASTAAVSALVLP